MKKLLLISIILLAGRVACGQMSAGPSISPTLPCRARTLDLRAKALSNATQDSCQYLFGQGHEYDANQMYQEAYDTLKLFVERCPFYPDYPAAWRAFNIMRDDAQGLYSLSQGDSTIYPEWRAWLESVLYLNTIDPEYFCQCVWAISGTFTPPGPYTRQKAVIQGVNNPLAVIQWLIQNTHCDSSLLFNEYNEGREGQYADWLDDSTLGNHYDLDTTLPTMQQLGLDTLLAKHALELVRDPAVPGIILSATASPNPVNEGTTITFGISQEAYVKIGLFDLLGHEVTSPGYEGLFESGNHEVPLSLQSLASGTYFARILTAYGNVATVKLVKE